MGKKLIFLFILLFLFSMNSFSAQSFQQTGGNLDIEYSKIETIKQNSDHHFHFQLSNLSSLLSNETAQCQFTLIKPKGFVQYRNLDIPFNIGTLNEFGLNVTKGNFTELGVFSFITQCFTDDETGFSSNQLSVTYSGFSLTDGQGLLYLSLFIILLFIFTITILGISQLPAYNERDEEGRVLSITYLKYFRPVGWMFVWVLLIGLLFLSSNLSFSYLNEQLFSNILITLFYISLAITPIIIIVWLLWIYASMFHDRQFQQMLNRGIFPQGKI